MGCDIHAAILYDYAPEFRTTFALFPNLPRHYTIFGALAGVRGPAGVAPLRGRLENEGSSWKDQVDKWAGDGHSHSWLTPAEYRQAMDMALARLRAEFPTIQPSVPVEYALINDLLDNLAIRNARFAFFFDN